MINTQDKPLSERELREEVIKLVHRAKTRLPVRPSHQDVERCFSLQIKEEYLPLDQDGAYIDRDAEIIVNNRVSSDERRNFTVYHELVHYLIRQDDDLYSYLHDTYEETSDFDRTIELVCNIGAAEFILPRESVITLISEGGFSLDLVPKICQKENVSGIVALIQLIQNAPNRSYGVICNYGILPRTEPREQQAFLTPPKKECLHILYAVWSPSARYSVARFTRIPKTHILYNALGSDGLIRGKDRIPFRSGTDWRVPAETMSFRGKAYGLFNVSPPPDPQQPKLFK